VVRDYLAVWHEHGRAAASDQFLVPSERGGGNDVALRLGKVISYRPTAGRRLIISRCW